MKEELKAFHINIDDIEQSKDLLININEAINKMKQNYVAERFEVVLNNNLLEAKDKYTNFRTILGCRISYDNLDKDISFIVREDKKPTYEELEQELQRKDNEIKQLREDIVNHIKIASEYKEQMIIKNNNWNELKNYVDKLYESETYHSMGEVLDKINELEEKVGIEK